MNESIADMKCQMNDVRDQKNKCENEVGSAVCAGYQRLKDKMINMFLL